MLRLALLRGGGEIAGSIILRRGNDCSHVMKKGGNTARILYSKTREHPAKRFAQYWDIPESSLIYAFNDLFIDGKGIGYTLSRLNAWLSIAGKGVSEDRFDNFVVASKKYMFWREKALSRKQQNTLHISKNAIQDIDFKRTKHAPNALTHEE